MANKSKEVVPTTEGSERVLTEQEKVLAKKYTQISRLENLTYANALMFLIVGSLLIPVSLYDKSNGGLCLGVACLVASFAMYREVGEISSTSNLNNQSTNQ
jgi:hypothetical protein